MLTAGEGIQKWLNVLMLLIWHL